MSLQIFFFKKNQENLSSWQSKGNFATGCFYNGRNHQEKIKQILLKEKDRVNFRDEIPKTIICLNYDG